MGMLYEYSREEREIITGESQMSKHTINKGVRWYLAGPMTGIKAFNYPLFDSIAAVLRADGFNVVSPVESEPPEARRISEASLDGNLKSMPPGDSYGKALARAMPSVVDLCGGIILLPGWRKSKGARIEAFTGLLCGKQFATWRLYGGFAAASYSEFVASQLRESLAELSYAGY